MTSRGSQANQYGTQSGLSSVFKSFARSFKPSGKPSPVLINPTVVGGGADQQELFNSLKSGSIANRTKAATKLVDSLNSYSISSIPEIWYCARDLLDHNVSASTRKIILQLLLLCIEKDEQTAISARLVYFKDITSNCIVGDKMDPEFNLFLICLRKLTNDGRDIHDFCIYDEMNLSSFLCQSLTTLKNSTNTNNELFAIELTQFIDDCFKHNFNLFHDTEINIFMTDIIEISNKSTFEKLKTSCDSLIETVSIYGTIPSKQIFKSIEAITAYSVIDDNFNRKAWEIIQYLVNTDSPQSTIFALCELLDTPISSQFDLNSHVGCINMFDNLLIANIDHLDLELTSHLILKSIASAATIDDKNINLAILRLFVDLLGEPEKVEMRLPFQFWYSNTFSIYDILDKLVIQDQEEVAFTRTIFDSLQSMYLAGQLPGSKERLVDFFLSHSIHLSKSHLDLVLDCYSKEKLCLPLNASWKANCLKLLDNFYFEKSKDVSVKLKALEVIKEAFDFSVSVLGDESLFDIMLHIFKNSVREENVDITNLLLRFFVEIASSTSLDHFRGLTSIFMACFQRKQQSERRRSLVSLSSTNTQKSEYVFSDYLLESTAKAVVKLFIICSTTSGEKARELYEMLITISDYALVNEKIEILLVVSRCLIRLRTTSEGFAMFVTPGDMEGLASTLGRNMTGVDPETRNSDSKTFKWIYPENDQEYLPKKFFYKPSKILKFYKPDYNSAKLSFGNFGGENTLDISKWLNIVVSIMDQYIDWEIYSFIWAHFCPQLANLSLFKDQVDGITRLRAIICDQLMTKFPSKLSLPSAVTKADLQVAFVRTLSGLIAYHDLFSKYDEDQIINSLLFGLGSWEKTAIPCIHCLTVCCYEFPLSIKKFLSAILTKLQTRISSSFASAHILEFLLSLAHLPSLTSNFTLDEFKRVFGIAFKYIQYSHDTYGQIIGKKSDQNSSFIQTHGVDATVESKPSTEGTAITPMMAQYLLTLSYSVISSWFLKMKLSQRKQLSSFLMKNLILTSGGTENETDITNISDQSMAFLDLISRFTYSDLDLRINSTKKGQSDNQKVLTNSWIIGISILTISSNIETGESVITTRRPTGITIFKIKPDESMVPMIYVKHKKQSKENLDSSTSPEWFSPNYMLLQLVQHMDKSSQGKPIPLQDDPQTNRAISAIDFTPIVEFHKIGMIYIGPGQSEEEEILGNNCGSQDYHKFLKDIGSLIKLKDCKNLYVGGLDTTDNVDGDYAIFWDDKISQVIFHTTTLMPNKEEDKVFSLKKRHIGNNYVNIFFNESGLPFDFNVIKSQFNFLNIVIRPHTDSTTIYNYRDAVLGSEAKIGIGGQSKNFFKVKIFRRSGVPGIFASSHFKLVSEENLAIFVRNLAVLANQFASVWHSNGSYDSNWSQRMKQIKTLREKALQYHKNLKQEQQSKQNGGNSAGTTQSFLEQLQFDSSANTSNTGASSVAVENVQHRYEYVEEDDNELFKLMEFNSFTS